MTFVGTPKKCLKKNDKMKHIFDGDKSMGY